jgi:two-component system, chemotaxis family, sensor kinase CheA
MTIDLRRFHSTFFEESLEAVTAMEAELLELERLFRRGAGSASIDAETVNRLFRDAHSIKGSSGTFGFQQIADFAHLLESLLDDARAGRRVLDPKTVDLLLRSVEAMRNLLTTTRDGAAEAPQETAALRAELERVGAPPTQAQALATSPAEPAHPWKVQFRPHTGLFRTGNDPLRLLRAVAALGRTTVLADDTQLPPWDAFDPESCYLAWELQLHTPAARTALEEVFAWVADDCRLELERLTAAPANVKTEEAASSIRVATDKVDALVDLVGELLITQTMLSQLVDDLTPATLPQLRSAVAQLARHTRELQDGVLGIRMLPIAFVFSRLPRMVRDVSATLGKQVELLVSGERAELDKTIIERISDPLIHLVRNSIGHGIETPEERARLGKPPFGTIRLDAYHKGGNFVLDISDDGRGLDRDRILRKARERGLVGADASLEPSQIDEFIFVPGFSTAEAVNDVSGRGVGLDVVRNNIRTLGGGVEVSSEPGKGVRFTLRLPLTLAIVDGMSLQVGQEVYILPLAWIAESLRVRPEQVSQPAGGPEILMVRGDYLPLLRLSQIFNVPARTDKLSEGIVVIIETDGKRAGLFVDEVLGQQQVVLKSLDKHCQRLDGVAAATILGNGTVALILDAGSLARRAYGSMSAVAGTGASGAPLGMASAMVH